MRSDVYYYKVSMVYEKDIFFSGHLPFNLLFTSAVFLRYLPFLVVILDVYTSQFVFILTAKLMILFVELLVLSSRHLCRHGV